MTGLFNSDGVNQLLAAHLAGKRDYSLQLWSLLTVEAWHRMFIEDGICGITDYSLHDIRGGGNSCLNGVTKKCEIDVC